ncbi:MAG TPA: aldehyde dehydrogenase family protein [Gammaproteobacteria bacterium]|nr:aldehyde dehydrogenase family protein [Xanthomonadales bacterium]MCB1593998.1 aldehyde dehydrogenase family protein [Xanthomonadales bacterium]HOP21692.1 aldehyde dehydrogenase family protein [Gammaproteobacteria bacterium]HPI95601.1 aldehyde dehydrogenase family protein [Gammaproteobacteria bacterium]HPQ86816.1 aldehyde dehydrogenase family protein [Gammaproteobacteria bacterium]
MKFLDELGVNKTNLGSCFGHNDWIENKDSGLIESYNPATGELIGSVYSASEADYEKVVTEAQHVFKEWRTTPAPKRGEAVRVIGDALRKHKDALGSLVAAEMGKIKSEGDGEVQEMIDMADLAVGMSRQLYGKTMHSERPGHRMYEQWHPLGVVGIISAFNFPVAVWSWNAFVAAVCGNVSIWKPSPKVPLCSIAVQNICNKALEEAGFPPIFMLFNDGSNELAQKFVDDSRINLISFTGSCHVGKRVGVQVAKRMGRSLLELGGNNALIVDKSADLKLAIPAIVFGAVGTAGQRCTTTRRLFLHEDIADEVTEKLVNAYKQVKIGNPLNTDTLMGPLIDETSVNTFLNAVQKAKDSGGEVLTGGTRVDGEGHFVTPCIIRAQADWQIVKDETFAPILYVMTFSDIDKVIEEQNDVVQGLSSALFTNDLRHEEKFLSSFGSDCGIANINIGTSGAEIGGAFGGEKETGGGREAGSDSWKAYMRRQTNTINYSTELPLAQGIKFNLD